MADAADISNLSFEQALAELERIVGQLETGQAPLEDSIALYERATRTLFSGDVIYDGMLIDNAWHSDPEAYEHSLRRLRELPVEHVHAGHEGSFGRDRLITLIDSFLAGGQRLDDPSTWTASVTA